MATSTIQNMNSSSFKQSKTPSPLSRLRASYSRQQHLSSEYWQQRLNNSPAQLDRRTKQMPSTSGLLRTLLLQEDDDIERVTTCLKRDLRELADDELLNDLTTAILRCRIRRLKRKQLNSNDAPLSPKPKSLDSATNVNQDSVKKNKMRSSLRLDTTVPAPSTNSRISGNIGDGDSPSSTSTNSCSSGSAPVPAQQRVQFLKEARQRRFGENEVQPKKHPEVPSELAEKYQDMSLQDGETKDETNKKKEQDNEQAQTNEVSKRLQRVHISNTATPELHSGETASAAFGDDSKKKKDADVVVSNLMKEFDLLEKSSPKEPGTGKNKNPPNITSVDEKKDDSQEEDPSFIPTPPSPDFTVSSLFSPDVSEAPTSKVRQLSKEENNKNGNEENSFITPRFMEPNSFSFPTDEKNDNNDDKENNSAKTTTTSNIKGMTMPEISKLRFVIGSSNGSQKKNSSVQQRRNQLKSNRQTKNLNLDTNDPSSAQFAPQPPSNSSVKKKETKPLQEANNTYSQAASEKSGDSHDDNDVDMMDITMEECSPQPQQRVSTPLPDPFSLPNHADNKSSSKQNGRSAKKKEAPIRSTSWNFRSSDTTKTDEFLAAAIAQGIRFTVGKSGKVVPNITPPRNREAQTTDSSRKMKQSDNTTSTVNNVNISNSSVNNNTSTTDNASKLSTDELLAAAAARAAQSAGQTGSGGFSVDIGKSANGKKKASPRNGSSRVMRFGSGTRHRGPPAPDNNLRSPGSDTAIGMFSKSFSSQQPVSRSLFSPDTMNANAAPNSEFVHSEQEPTRKPSPLFRSKDAMHSMNEKYNPGKTTVADSGKNESENLQSQEIKVDAEQQEAARRKAKYEQIIALRDIGRSLYIDGKYKESVLKYTASIAACTNNFSSKQEDINDIDLLATLYGNRAAGLMMIGAYNASASDCTKALSCLKGFKETLSSKEIIELATRSLRPDGGVTLATKLFARKGRSCLKSGQSKLAEEAFDQSIRIGRLGLLAQQRARDAKLQNGDDSGPSEADQLAEKSLNQTITESTINKSEATRLKEFMKSIQSLGGVSTNPDTAALKRNNLQLLHLLNSAAALASGDSSLQESRITCLASLKRWTEVASYCERLACDNVKADGVFVDDLKDDNPFPGIEKAKFLKWNTFENENRGNSPVKTLTAKEAAEAIVRIPCSISKIYVRALRLEERYSEATKAVNALKNSKINVKSERYNWLDVEGDKIRKTMTGKDRGDSLYNRGEYKEAATKYAIVLTIDNDGDKTYQQKDPWDLNTSGGRLHAVLHCNRAACLMALKQYREASKECTAALRIQSQYMKAILRRARCYARMEHFEESIAEYQKWFQLVDDAKKNGKGGSSQHNSCPFDRACDISNAEYKKANEELIDVKTSHRKAQVEAEARANRHQQWQSSDFRKSAPDLRGTQSSYAKQQRYNSFNTSAQNTKESNTYTKQQQWYSQQSDQSRRWDSFNGSGPKKSGQYGYKTNNNSNYHRSSSGRFNANKSGSNRYQSASDSEDLPSKKVDCHYKVLDVEKTATAVQIKKSYHKLALKYHPDKNKSPSSAENFRKVQQAYEILSNETSRRKYNAEIQLQQGTSYYY